MEMANSIGRNGSGEGETMLMGALMRLHPLEFSHLTGSLTADLRLQQRRLTILVLSTHHFSRTITYLHSLSLSQKTLLLARLLLRSLSILLQHHHHYQNHLCHLRLEEFDAALLLMTMCEVYDPNEPREGGQSFDWRTRIAQHLLDRALCPSELGAHLGSGVLSRYVDTAAKCRRLLEAVTGGSRGGRAGEDIIKSGKEVATSLTVVVSLPSVECQIEGWECVVCKEVIQVGRDVCVLPCEHGFHWGCILPWLRKRNTCPCCRFELPTDDVFCEIERVWRSAIKMGQLRSYCGDDDNV